MHFFVFHSASIKPKPTRLQCCYILNNKCKYIYIVPGHEQICLQVVFVQLGPVARKASQNMNFKDFSCSFWGTLQGCRSHIPPNGFQPEHHRLKNAFFLGDISEFPLGGNFQFPSFFFGNFQFPSFSSISYWQKRHTNQKVSSNNNNDHQQNVFIGNSSVTYNNNQ